MEQIEQQVAVSHEIKSRSSFRVARVPEGIKIVEIVERPQP